VTLDVGEPTPTRPRPATVDLDLDRTGVRRLEFVEVGAANLDEDPEHRLRRGKPDAARRLQPPPPKVAEPIGVGTPPTNRVDPAKTIRPQQGSTEPRWSLWSDGEV